jgi:hypothetical protein
MKITHNSKTGKTTITLSWLETRQLIDIPAVGTLIHAGVKNLVQSSFAGKTTKTVSS